MKATIYKNVDLVAIPIKSGISEYYLPQNVSWAKEKVDKIVLCTPTESCVSPIDGETPVMQSSGMNDMYLNIFTSEDKEIMYDTHSAGLVHTNNHPIMVDSVLNLSLCKLYFTTAPTTNSCILMYVFYGSKIIEDYEPATRSMTVSFPLQPNEKITFQSLINTYIHALPSTVRGITCWSSEENPAYMTLRDHQLSYIFRDLHTEMCRPTMVGSSATTTQVCPFLTDNMDIDFDYSFIQNATSSENIQIITFEF